MNYRVRHGIYEVPILATEENYKGCSVLRNNSEQKKLVNNLKRCSTRAQREECRRINEICKANNIKPIREDMIDTFNKAGLKTILDRKYAELRNQGIDFASADKVYCDKCKFYKPNFSSCGKCIKHNRQTKARYNCKFGEEKAV